MLTCPVRLGLSISLPHMRESSKARTEVWSHCVDEASVLPGAMVLAGSNR